MSRRLTVWLLLLALVIGAFLRIYQLNDRSLWFDEAFSWRLVLFPVPEMITRAAADVHPPLYYFFLKGWTGIFGSSLAGLRGFSVALGLATILMTYRFAATAWHSRFVGVTAALSLAVAGWQISYAWEARMYTLGIFLSLLASYLLITAIRRERSVPRWLLYGLAMAAFAYTHYFAFFTLVGHALFVVGYILVKTKGRVGEILQSPRFWWAGAAVLLAVALYAPWIPTFLRQNAQVQQSFWVPPITSWSIPDTFYRMYIPLVNAPPHEGFGKVLAFTPIALTILLWLLLPIMYRRAKSDAAYLTVLSAAMPFVLAIIVSSVGQSLYQDRFLVFTHVFILITIAAVLGKLPRSLLRTSLATLFIIFLFTTHWLYRQDLALPQKPGARAAAYTAYANPEPAEPVLVTSPFVYFAIDHYAREELKTTPPRLYTESANLLHFAGGPILTDEDVFLASELQANPPVSMWVIDTTGFGGQEHNFGPDWQSIERHVYPEVFPHQGDVIVHHYRYQP